jgi:hypothetical protein
VHRSGAAAHGHEPGHGPPGPAGLRLACIAIDDFGLQAGINQAAWELVQAGRVQAIGCQVGGPDWADGVRLLRHLQPDSVDLGLHLDLTERPLAPGTARPLAGLIADAYLGRLDGHALRLQIRAQLGAFSQALGRPPDYIDGHQHVHQLPGVRDALLAELAGLAGQGTRHRPWLRATVVPAGLRQAGLPWFKPRVIQALGAAGLARLARAQGLRTNRCLLGVYDFQGGAGGYARLLAGWMQAGGTGDVLMCHASTDARTDDPLCGARHAEFQVLAGQGFGPLCKRAGIGLQPLRRILGLPQSGA